MQPFLKRANVLSLMERKFYLVKFHVLYANIWFLHSKNLKLSEARTIQQCEQKEHSVCSHSCVDRCTSGWERVSDCLPPLHHLVASVCGRAWISMESWGLIVDPHGCVVWVSLTDHYSSLYTCFCWGYFFMLDWRTNVWTCLLNEGTVTHITGWFIQVFSNEDGLTHERHCGRVFSQWKEHFFPHNLHDHWNLKCSETGQIHLVFPRRYIEHGCRPRECPVAHPKAGLQVLCVQQKSHSSCLLCVYMHVPVCVHV